MEVPSWATAPDRDVTVLVTVPYRTGGEATAPVRVTLSDRKSAWFFGRNSDVCDVAVPHANVSRVHACLAHCEGRFFLIDMGSVHGTPPPPPPPQTHRQTHTQTHTVKKSTSRY